MVHNLIPICVLRMAGVWEVAQTSADLIMMSIGTTLAQDWKLLICMVAMCTILQVTQGRTAVLIDIKKQ